MKWSPVQLGDLFFDNKDLFGIIFWYEPILEVVKKINTPANNVSKAANNT